MRSPSSGTAATSKQQSILVLDDNLLARKWIESVLSESYSVRTTESLSRATRMLLDEPPDLFLVDVNMPGLDGPSFVRQINADLSRLETVVVLYSSENTEVLAELSMRLGVSGYIQKSSEPEQMRNAVERYLRARRLPASRESRIKKAKVWVAPGVGSIPSQGFLSNYDITVFESESALTSALRMGSPAILLSPENETLIRNIRGNPLLKQTSILLVRTKGLINAPMENFPSIQKMELSSAMQPRVVNELLNIAPRRKLMTFVKAEVGRDELIGFSRNISKSGLLVVFEKPLLLNSKVDLELKLPAEANALRCLAEVVREHQNSSDDGVALGLRFINLPQIWTDKVNTYVNS